jgi:ABC-type transport system involved in multi-copper enzyme maturation permease subunit
MSVADWMNPVTLKELRQMVRSRLVAAGLIGFLAISLITIAIVLLGAQDELRHGIPLGEQGLGSSVFSAVFVILALLLLFAAPFFVGGRMGAERSNEHLDLQYTTILKPRQLVDGKIAAAVIMLLLFVGASLPFLSLAYLLRGLDLLQALLATLMLVLVAVACLFVALFLATAATSRVFRVLLVPGMLSFQGMIVSGAIGGAMAMVHTNGLSLSSWSDAVAPGLFLAGWLSACLLLRTATTSLVMPAAANRAPAVRGWITALWGFWGAVAGLFAWHETTTSPIMIWALISILAFTCFGGIALSCAPGYSRRVLGEVSPRRWRRHLQFLFFSGAENGMLWAFGMTGLTLLAVFSVEWLREAGWKAANDDGPDAMPLAVLCGYLTAYLWSVRALWRGLLHRRVTYRLAGVVAAALMLLGWGLPYLAAIGSPTQTASWAFGNPFAVFYGDLKDIGSTTVAVCIWVALALAANLPGLLAARRAFVPLPQRPGTYVTARPEDAP